MSVNLTPGSMTEQAPEAMNMAVAGLASHGVVSQKSAEDRVVDVIDAAVDRIRQAVSLIEVAKLGQSEDDRLLAICDELAELTGDAVNADTERWVNIYWNGDRRPRIERSLWSSKMGKHFHGNTWAECEAAFRAAWAEYSK